MRYGKAKRKQVDAESDPEDLKAAAARLDELLMPVRAPKEEKLALASRPEHLPGLVYCKHCDRPIKPEFAYAPTNPKSKVPLCKMLDCKSHRKPVEDSLLLNPDIDKADDSEDEGDAASDAQQILNNFTRPQEFAGDFASAWDKKSQEPTPALAQEEKDLDVMFAGEEEEEEEENVTPSRAPIPHRLNDDYTQVVDTVKSDQDLARALRARPDLDAKNLPLPFWHPDRSRANGALMPHREPVETVVAAKKVDEIKLLDLAAKALVKKRLQKEEMHRRRKIDKRVRLHAVLKKANHSLKGLYHLTPQQLVKLLNKLKPCPLTGQEDAFYRDHARGLKDKTILERHGPWSKDDIYVIENRIIGRAIDDGLIEAIIPGETGGGFAEPTGNYEKELDLIRRTGGSTLGGRIHGGRLPDRVPGSRKGVGHYKLEDFNTAPTFMGRGGKAAVDNGSPEHDDHGEESTA
jgi:hypothetical protein